MQFKDIKQNYTLFILDKQEFKVYPGKVIGASFPRLEMNPKTNRSEMVVDITVEANGKTATYAIPENLSVSYAGNIILATDKQGLVPEVEAMVANADQIISSVPYAKRIKDEAPAVLAELNPAYREKQETEQRLGKIEGSIAEMQKMMENFIKKFEN